MVMGMHSGAPLAPSKGLGWWAVRGIAVLGVMSLGAVALGAAIGDDDREGTVVRVIDGDTLVALVGGEETTIRLLNIDTPETKHPDLPVQCLGPEATDFLAERLPAGTEIELEYDEERLDRYDRTLAGVYESGSLINAEIAAEGLGVPVLFEPNDRFLPEVEEAAATAQTEGLGLFSAATECTVPAQVETLAAAAEQIPATVEGDPAQTLADATTLVEDAEALVGAVDADALGTGTNAVLALPLVAAYADGQREAAVEARDRAVEGRDRVQGLKDDWDEEQERIEREKREREERERREREERERKEREEREEQERRAQESAGPSSSDAGSGEKSSGSDAKGSGARSDSGARSESGGSSSSGSSETGRGNSGRGGSGGGKSGSGSSSSDESGRGGGSSSSGGSGGGRSGSGGSGSGGGGRSGCEPYGPEIPYADDGGYTGKRYGMPGGKTFRKCS